MGRLTLKQRILAVGVGALIAAAQAASPSMVAHARSAARARSAEAARMGNAGSRS